MREPSVTNAEACPICEGATVRRFRKQDADYRRCERCGFVFARGRTNPNLERPLGEFEPAYLQYLRDDPNDRANFERAWRWMARFGVSKASRLLDVGAGSGKFVRFLRSRGVAGEGIEPSPALFEAFLKDEAHFTFGELRSLRPAADAAFDVVTAFDVIEHVQEPLPFLCDLAAVLKPGGLAFISAPDVSSAAARVFGKYWHFYNRYHLSYFSPAVLARAAASFGLQAIDCSYQGRVRSLGYITRYLMNFGLGTRIPAPAAFDRIQLPINVFDTMHVVLRKPPSSAAVPGS
jgi:2-polyprenyl-3-methyl-5-hydroxy-6-metoxy-1,4-benzoquinol methylase